MISVLVTLVSLVLVWGKRSDKLWHHPRLSIAAQVGLVRGVFAVYYLVASLIGIPKLGAAAVFSLVLAGQMVGALALDSTGAFAMAQIPLSPARIFGTILLLAGAILI